jgi:ATP-dependent DNA helicase RecG
MTTLLRGLVGGPTAKALESLDLLTVADLLHHYPRRYVRRGQLMPFAELSGLVGEHVTLLAEVQSVSSNRIRTRQGKQMQKTDVRLRDGAGSQMTLTWFNRYDVKDKLGPGDQVFFAGKVGSFRGEPQLTNPEFARVEDEGMTVDEFAAALVPLYPANSKVSTFTIARSVKLVLDLADTGAEPLPPEIRDGHGLLPLNRALRLIHQPKDEADHERAKHRLAWDEAFVLQTVLAQRRAAALAQPGTPRPGRSGGLLDAFDAQLPFTLTDGQRDVGEQLAAELAEPHPMHRLLQGEVGSGKTLVALRAMLRVVDSGGQAALLAPTEVLAQQHARGLAQLLGPLAEGGLLGGAEGATRIALLTGSLGAAAKRAALLDAASGRAGIVVGTHALLSEHVQFADLGLVVVDEQHRFGVEQRDALRAKGEAPHVLVMTATPIPRTVAMTVFGDLEVSTLSELPRGRSPIATHVVAPGGRAWDRIWEKVREEAAQGHRAFVVCPRIDPDEKEPAEGEEDRRPAAAVEEVFPMLADGELAGLRVASLHGAQPAEVKDDTMLRFAAGELDVLVATTVIEVGVDVPEATVMVILDADRFGVSQLHQLRGRVGRGRAPGLCVLVTQLPPLSPAGERLQAVAGTLDGFALSEIDLEQRREGNVLGVAQSGTTSGLRFLRITNPAHVELLQETRRAATDLVAADPDLVRHPALRAAVDAVLSPDEVAYLDKS